MKAPHPLLVTLAAASLVGSIAAAPPAAGAAGAVGDPPGATLLFPYFEVDLADPQGITTLVAIGNASDEPRVAHAVLWTDWGIPSLSFDLNLTKDQVVTLNLRDVFAGALPANGAAGGCPRPPLDAAAVTRLRRQHSGQPTAEGCYGSTHDDRAVGYLTVDVVRGCAAGKIRHPSDPGYFVQGGNGFATNANALWGDYELIEPSEDFAHGFEAVQIPADASIRERTFYRRYAPDHTRLGEDKRAGLGSLYRTRYLTGGTFAGGTDLLLWLETSKPPPAPSQCGDRFAAAHECQSLHLSFYDEAGARLSQAVSSTPPRLAFRLRLGTAEEPTPAPFGFVELENYELVACQLIPIAAEPLQAWPTVVLRAEGRFSVGIRATRLD